MMLMDVLRPYRGMAYNSAWANHRLLAACSTQADDCSRRARV
jgi:uncharacterized damage-inducible protein DinB